MFTAKTGALALFIVALAGCVSTPPATISYYYPKAATEITATQTVTCNKAGTQVNLVTSVDFITTYATDYDKAPLTFDPRSADSLFSDSGIEVALTEDGRLKSINTTSEGVGEAVAKSFSAFAPMALGGAAADTSTTLPICQTVADFTGDKPAIVSYRTTLDFSRTIPTAPIELEPDEGSTGLFRALPQLPTLRIIVGTPQPIAPPVAGARGNAGAVLTLPRMALLEITVRTAEGTIATEHARILHGGTYAVPMPKAKLFGDAKFSLTLADSGAVTAIGYTKKTGVSAAIDSTAAVHAALVPGEAVLAERLGAKSDRIAQQNRLAACMSDPASCH